MKNFKQFVLVMLMFLLVSFAIVYGSYFGKPAKLVRNISKVFSQENTACYKDQCYTLELAVTEKQKAKGLQNRDELEKDAGMLFFMNNRNPQKFWMKETHIPLDIIWLDDFGKVLYLEHAVPPCEADPCPTYGPNFPSAYVLELNAGEAARLDIRVGERITLGLRNVKKFD